MNVKFVQIHKVGAHYSMLMYLIKSRVSLLPVFTG